MKRFILLGCSLAVTAIASHAQNNATSYNKNNMLKEILQKQRMRGSEAKPTADKKRVLASSKYVQGEINDSVRNYYSGTRGSYIDNTMDNISATSSLFFPGFEKQINKCDSFTEWSIIEDSPTIVPLFHGTFAYNAAQRASAITLGIANFDSETEYNLFYNPAGQLERWEQLDPTGGANTIKTFRQYDNQGRKTMDSTFDAAFTNEPVNKITYHYDNDGNLAADTLSQWESGNWTVYNTSQYVYDPQERLEIAAYKDMSSGSLQSSTRINYLYLGANVIPQVETHQVWENSAWADDEKTVTQFTSSGIPVSLIHAIRTTSGNLDTAEKRDIIYNTDDLVKDLKYHAYENGAFQATPYRVDHWYYETYNDGTTTGVKHLDVNEKTVNVYPIPARDVLYITAGKADKLNRVEVFSGTGQLVKQFDCKSQDNFRFSVDALAEGLYFVKTYTGSGSCTHRVAVQHQ